MDFRGYAFLFKPGGKDLRIRGGDLLTREPRYPRIVDLFGNRQGESALAESQPFYDGYVLPPFEDLVLPHNARIGRPAGNGLGNVVITEIEYFHREIHGRGYQVTPAYHQFDAGFFYQFQRPFIQPPLGLDRNSQFFLHSVK